MAAVEGPLSAKRVAGGEKWEPKKNWNGGVSVWGKVGKWNSEKRKRGEGSREGGGGLMEMEKVLIEERGATEVGQVRSLNLCMSHCEGKCSVLRGEAYLNTHIQFSVLHSAQCEVAGETPKRGSCPERNLVCVL